MTGLILKDFFNVFRQWKFWAIYFVGMGFFSVFSESFSMTGILMFIMPTIAMGAFGYDEQTKWDRYACSMPVSKKTIVLARYLLVGIMVLFSLAFGITINVISALVNGNEIFSIDNMLTLYVSAVIVLFYLSVQMVIMYKLGPEKGKVWTILLFLVPFGLVFGAFSFVNANGVSSYLISILEKLNWDLIGIIIIIIALLCIVISYNISVKIYSKKEF